MQTETKQLCKVPGAQSGRERRNTARHSLHDCDLSQLEFSQSDINPKQISVLI